MNAELTSKVIQNDEASVIELLARGADPDCRDSDGWTPLLIAVNENNANLVSILLAYGADAEAAESGFLGWTPLIVATLRRVY